MTKTGIIIQTDGTTERVEYTEDDNLEGITRVQDAIGGYLESVPNGHGLTVFANEDGRLLELPTNVNASHLCEQYILGNVVVFGPPDSDGDTTSVSDDQLAMIERM